MNLSPDLFVPESEHERRHVAVEDAKKGNEEGAAGRIEYRRKSVDGAEDIERRPAEDKDGVGADVDLRRFPLFPVDKVSSVGDPVLDVLEVVVEADGKGDLPLNFIVTIGNACLLLETGTGRGSPNPAFS